MNAVFTLANNEEVFLPLWLKYYTKLFDKVIVLNHDTDIDYLKKDFLFDEIKVSHELLHDHKWILPLVMEQQIKLLNGGFEPVLYAEADEFVIANPYKYEDLKGYMDNFVKKKIGFVHCKGFEPVQLDGEKEIDWLQPILAQRKYWVRFTPYDKPVMARERVNWCEGFHHIEGKREYKDFIKPLVDDDLYLVHLCRIDKTIFTTRPCYVYKHDMSRFYRDFETKEEIPEKFKTIL